MKAKQTYEKAAKISAKYVKVETGTIINLLTLKKL